MSYGACHTVFLSLSLIWSLVGIEQLHSSRDRVQRERKNPLSCPADTFKTYHSKEGAWKESSVGGVGGYRTRLTQEQHFKRCRVRPAAAKRGHQLWVRKARNLFFGSSAKSSPSLQNMAPISGRWDHSSSTEPMIATHLLPVVH